MKKKEIYITEDGEEFESKAWATIHEAYLESRNNKKKEFELVNGKKISKGDINMFFEKMDCPTCPYKEECKSVSNLTRNNEHAYNLCEIIHGGYAK